MSPVLLHSLDDGTDGSWCDNQDGREESPSAIPATRIQTQPKNSILFLTDDQDVIGPVHHPHQYAQLGGVVPATGPGIYTRIMSPRVCGVPPGRRHCCGVKIVSQSSPVREWEFN